MRIRSFAFDLLDRALTNADHLRLLRARKRRKRDGLISFSFPIATYERDDILVERTIPSLLNQTYESFEVRIVHDGSAPSLRKRLDLFNDRRIFFEECKRPNYPTDPVNRWMCAGFLARNIGLKHSRNNWIYWMSDDDVLVSNALETLATVIADDEECELVYGDYLAWEGASYVRKCEESESLTFPMTGLPAIVIRRDIGFMKWRHWSWKKSWNRPSDYDLLHRLDRAGVRMRYVPRILAVSPPVGNTGLTGSAAHLAIARSSGPVKGVK